MSGIAWILFGVRLLLAAVFVIAGIAKLTSRASFRDVLSDLAMPLPDVLSILIPLAELAVAGTLLITTFAEWGALATLALLLVFSGVFAYARLRGRKLECNCFGKLGKSQAGWQMIVRNALLVVLTGLFIAGNRSTPERIGFESLGRLSTLQAAMLTAVTIVGILLAVAGWLIARIAYENRRLLARIKDLETAMSSDAASRMLPSPQPNTPLPLGTPAPLFDLVDLEGRARTLTSLYSAGKPILLIFSDPACGPCARLLPFIARWQHELAEHLIITVISTGTPEVYLERARQYGLQHVLLQRSREVANLYRAYGTPSGILIRSDGTIGSPLAVGGQEISTMVTRIMEANRHERDDRGIAHRGELEHSRILGKEHLTEQSVEVNIGQPAPQLRLADLRGDYLDLHELRGNWTVVIFWSAKCVFCEEVLDFLEAWEKNPPPNAPTIILVATVTEISDRLRHLHSRVAVDPTFSAGRAFGTPGTPSAVLLDTQGNVASHIASGTPAVLALAGIR